MSIRRIGPKHELYKYPRRVERGSSIRSLPVISGVFQLVDASDEPHRHSSGWIRTTDLTIMSRAL